MTLGCSIDYPCNKHIRDKHLAALPQLPYKYLRVGRGGKSKSVFS